MPQTVELQTLISIIAVLLFVCCAIAVLVIVDSKARIRISGKPGAFSISGARQDHPAWAWMVGFVLLSIIAFLLFMALRSMVAGVMPKVKTQKGLMDTLVQEQVIEQRRVFHNARTPMPAGEKAVCLYCHGDFPHAKKPMIRTILNMHTQFVGCLTCHADADKIPEEELVFRWLNFTGIDVEGKPFGTETDPVTGGLFATDDFYSKIVLYRKKDGQEELIEIPESRPDARDFIPMRSQLDTAQQGAAKRRFHAHVNPIGRFCTRCHSPEDESFLPLRELGFSDVRVAALTNLNIVGIVQKYREFYIPTIFKQGMTEQQERALFGREVSVDRPIRTSPRDWWRGMYDPRPTEKAQPVPTPTEGE